MKVLATFLLVIAGCSKPVEPEPSPSTQTVAEAFADAQDRLASEHLENGWVCSRGAIPGYCEHAGDSLLWSGLWLGAASCDAGFESELALQGMIRRHDGALVRFDDSRPEFEEYRGGREVSFDGAIGLYAGIAARIKRCPETEPGWLEAMTTHAKFREENGGKLHSGVDSAFPSGFDVLPDLLLARLAGSGDPRDLERRASGLVAQSVAWAIATNATHAAAYRVHLAHVALQALESLDVQVSSVGRSSFCAATRGVDIPTVDHWCARGDLAGWVEGFEFNEWEYRHQRSGAWESPDGNGFKTPGLDLIVGIRQAFQL